MHLGKLTIPAILALFVVSAPSGASADEFGFSSYGLGSAAFGAGVTPPPGTYISAVSGYYQGKISGPITVGGFLVDVGLKAQFLSLAVNGMFVPDHKVLGGNLGLSATMPAGHIHMDAQVTGPLGNTLKRETEGWGAGDATARLQLGWQQGEFAHTAYVQTVAPTGRYSNGFEPNIGLHRPGIDTGWAFTWNESRSKLQFNGSFGVTFNFENRDTNYQSGTDFHFEWAIGREIAQGLIIGIVGYDYRQLTGDSGPGAVLGPFQGNVDAIGGGLAYTTLIGSTPLVINARHYWEYNAEKRMEGTMSILSGTMRF